MDMPWYGDLDGWITSGWCVWGAVVMVVGGKCRDCLAGSWVVSAMSNEGEGGKAASGLG